MRLPISVLGFAFVLSVLAAGCAAHSAAGQGSAMPQSDGPSALAGPGLTGTWRGTFGQVTTGDSGMIHGDIVSRIKDDGTYVTTWTTRLVAGSSRGGTLEMSGNVVANSSRVMFNDARSGSRMTLKRDGDTLYGVTQDPGTKRVTVAVELHRVSASPEAP
jgi:hypothetical protein